MGFRSHVVQNATFLYMPLCFVIHCQSFVQYVHFDIILKGSYQRSRKFLSKTQQLQRPDDGQALESR